MKKEDFKIIFMGTPEFAAESLRKIYESGFNIVGVITAPDKPAGRGRKLSESDVKKYAKRIGLNILQPTNLKHPDFISELKKLNADLFVVVAFRMLPEAVWNMPPKGTINLHASLLPQYRGAAPINHAIMQGETETGVTTFFIQQEIDTGGIIAQEKVEITEQDTVGTLHDKLMFAGAELLLKTINSIFEDNYTIIEQDAVISNPENLKPAPKIFKPDCRINWQNNCDDVYNFIRALNPYPAAWTQLKNKKTGKIYSLKIFDIEKIKSEQNHKEAGKITETKRNVLISCADGDIDVKVLQLQGKKRMPVKDFLNGYSLADFEITE